MTLDVDEALRCLGAGDGADPNLRRRVEKTAEDLSGRILPRWLYRVFPLERTEEGISLLGARMLLPGRTAEQMLEECGRAALLACTLGAEFDALLREEQVRDMSEAVILDACACAWVEAGCDAAEIELASRLPGCFLTDRFSPGYGDLSLGVQAEFCRALDTQRRLGLYVTSSLLLNPIKSVTAIIGIADRPQRRRIRGCNFCNMNQSCELRRRGTGCGL